MLKYKINILEELANAGYNTSRLRKVQAWWCAKFKVIGPSLLFA